MRAALLLITLSLAVLWAWLGQHPALHADALTLAEVWQGVRQGAGLGPWLFSAASSLFPDLGAVALANAFSSNLAEQQRCYGMVVGVGLGWGGARLIQQFLALEKWQARAYAAAGLILGLVLIPAHGFGDVLAPGHHGWACVLAIWAWAWAMDRGSYPRDWRPQVGLAVMGGLILASDGLFLLWACLPLLWLGLSFPAYAKLRIWMTSLLALPLSWLALAALKSTGAKVGVFRWPYAQAHAQELWQTFMGGMPVLVSENVGALAVTGLGFALWFGAARKAPQAAWALGAWAMAMGASVAVCVLAGPYGRYLLFPFWALFLMVPAMVALRWPGLGPAALLGPALLGLLYTAKPAPTAEPLELRQAAWLDGVAQERGLSYGFSDYAHSRPLRLFSRRQLKVLPMITLAPDRLEPHLWVVDRRLFPGGQAPARPQFAVVNGLDAAVVQARQGKPDLVLRGEGLELWILKDQR